MVGGCEWRSICAADSLEEFALVSGRLLVGVLVFGE